MNRNGPLTLQSRKAAHGIAAAVAFAMGLLVVFGMTPAAHADCNSCTGSALPTTGTNLSGDYCVSDDTVITGGGAYQTNGATVTIMPGALLDLEGSFTLWFGDGNTLEICEGAAFYLRGSFTHNPARGEVIVHDGGRFTSFGAYTAGEPVQVHDNALVEVCGPYTMNNSSVPEVITYIGDGDGDGNLITRSSVNFIKAPSTSSEVKWAATCDPAVIWENSGNQARICNMQSASPLTYCNGTNPRHLDLAIGGLTSGCPAVANNCGESIPELGQCAPNDPDCGTPDCTSDAECSDNNVCNGAETCNAGVCQAGTNATAVTPCGDSSNSTCDGADTCDGAGSCADNLAPATTSCDDSNACTSTSTAPGDDDTCDGAGACDINDVVVGGACGDSSSSTCDGADTCDGAGSCDDNLAPATTSCSDGLHCNGDEICNAGVCQPGTAPTCDDVCDEDSDACVECIDDNDCGDGSVCDEGTNTCIACTDNTSGGLDDGCTAGDPVCDDTTAGSETCLTCEDNNEAGQTDNGCSDALPACDDTDASVPSCVECSADADCADGSVCDEGTNTCIACTDNTSGGLDDGCTAGDPVCDDTTAGSETCLTCEDNNEAGQTDNGCSDALPACDDNDATAPTCVECLTDGDCGSGDVCDLNSNTCIACMDNSDGAQDAGCDAADPVCDDTVSGAETCLTCEDNREDGLIDNGCDNVAPACLEADGGAPTCVECITDADCPVGGACGDGNTCIGCTDDTDGGQDTGCDAANPACDDTVSGAETCLLCEDNRPAGETDNGCAVVQPACDDSDASAPVCVECLADGDCADGSVCHAGTSTCIACIDDTVGGQDGGCDATGPVCDDSTAGAEMCVTCEDNNGVGETDNGCDAQTPICDEGGETPECFECQVDADCGGGLCDGGECLEFTAGDDVAATPEDTDVLINVLINDGGRDGGLELVVSGISTEPSHGEAVINDDGTVTYSPDENYNGIDTFTYVVCSDALCREAVVTISVAPANDAPVAADDSATTPLDTPVIVDVLANDADPDDDNDAIVVTSVDIPSHGTAEIAEDGTVAYTPEAGYEGEVSFGYSVCDEFDACDTATITINVGVSNTPPVAVADGVNLNEDAAPVVIDVLANDSDPDGDDITVVSVTQPSHGTATINDDGEVVYTVEANYDGFDSFTYTLCDAPGDCVTADVEITITGDNDSPVAVDDEVTVEVGTTTSIPVLDNDHDPDGDTLRVTEVSEVSGGVATIEEDGTITFTPDDGFTGDATFTYTACDAEGACADATVTVHVSDGGNTAPVAQDDAYTATPGEPAELDVLDNDTDADGDPIAVSEVQQPDHGDVVINPDGTLQYTPDAGYEGEDTFTYEICDDKGLCDSATVTLNVDDGIDNGPPVAEDDYFAVDQDTPTDLPVLDNDSDPDGDALVITEVEQPDSGTVVIGPDGTLTYTPEEGFVGEVSFEYEVCDADNACDRAVVTLEVGDASRATDRLDLRIQGGPCSGGGPNSLPWVLLLTFGGLWWLRRREGDEA
ncbi:MAG: Cys-rich repeat protein/VCBS repeat-containing protein [Myxococcota bacterium]|jgi:Cys-rich repeat protein/VCBS repeat-containing protein